MSEHFEDRDIELESVNMSGKEFRRLDRMRENYFKLLAEHEELENTRVVVLHPSGATLRWRTDDELVERVLDLESACLSLKSELSEHSESSLFRQIDIAKSLMSKRQLKKFHKELNNE